MMTPAVKPACSVVLALVTAAVLGARGPAAAHSSFDGTWNVLFVTEAGQCGPPFRYDISIVNGVVVTSAEAAHDMSGHVDLNGNVRVSIYRAAERAVGSGWLQNNSGQASGREYCQHTDAREAGRRSDIEGPKSSGGASGCIFAGRAFRS
jgi:hypothetical protein